MFAKMKNKVKGCMIHECGNILSSGKVLKIVFFFNKLSLVCTHNWAKT